MCPTSIHEDHETCSGFSQRKGNKINNLPGRSPDHFQQSTVPDDSDQFDPRIISGIGPSNQREQIAHGTYPGDCVLGISSVIDSYDHISSSGENQEDQTGGSLPSEEALSVNTVFGHLCGNDHSSQTSYTCGSIISLSTSGTDKQCGFPSSISRSSTASLSSGNSLISGGEDRAGMVGARGSYPQSITSDTTSTKHDYRDRRLFNRLGCPTSRVPDRGQWSVEEKQMHINTPELLAVSLALKTFAKDKSHVDVLIRTDNVSAKAYINHLVGTHSHQLNSIAVQLWKWCLDRHISLTAEHLPGKNNQVADEESRAVRDRCDWMIHPELFARIHQEMGPLDVDLFASRLTYQLPRLYS